jgi:ferritin-like metal-binding protein YciE
MDTAKKNLENIEVHFENVRPTRHRFDGESGLRDLLTSELKSLYCVEKTLLRAFPKLIKNSCSFDLIEALTIHQEETKLQVIRLEDVFAILSEEPQIDKSVIIETLLDSIDLNIEDTKFGTVRDAGIILGMSQIEQFETATYGTLATYAENLKEMQIAQLLSDSINEEKVAQLRLAKIANTIRFYNTDLI